LNFTVVLLLFLPQGGLSVEKHVLAGNAERNSLPDYVFIFNVIHLFHSFAEGEHNAVVDAQICRRRYSGANGNAEIHGREDAVCVCVFAFVAVFESAHGAIGKTVPNTFYTDHNHSLCLQNIHGVSCEMSLFLAELPQTDLFDFVAELDNVFTGENKCDNVVHTFCFRCRSCSSAHQGGSLKSSLLFHFCRVIYHYITSLKIIFFINNTTKTPACQQRRAVCVARQLKNSRNPLVFIGFCGMIIIYTTDITESGVDMTEVVAALIWDKEKFMICQRPAHKARGLLWEFVGGKVEPGETKEQALIRECREELDVTLSVGDVFMEVVHEYPDITVHLTLFNANIAEGIPQKLEHNDIKWITPDEIPNYDFCPADEEILIEIRKNDSERDRGVRDV